MTLKISYQGQKISYQGEPGAYSDLVALNFFPGTQRLGMESFEAVAAAVLSGDVDHAVIPVKSLAGSVTTSVNVLRPLPLFVMRAEWQPIRHCLLALPGTSLADIKSVHSHWQALAQCTRTIAAMGLPEVVEYDTAGAAKLLAAEGDKTKAAIASSLAAETYDLVILKEGMEDQPNNRTFFLALSKDAGAGRPVADVLKELEL